MKKWLQHFGTTKSLGRIHTSTMLFVDKYITVLGALIATTKANASKIFLTSVFQWGQSVFLLRISWDNFSSHRNYQTSISVEIATNLQRSQQKHYRFGKLLVFSLYI